MRAADMLLAVTALGGRLQPAGDQLCGLLPIDCPAELKNGIRQHKPELLALLQSEFLIIRSAALNETIFFAADEETKRALVDAGAEPGCVYTREELRLLIDQPRHEPITAAELLRLHTAKRIFNRRISPKPKGL
jgi:hypothetical protein